MTQLERRLFLIKYLIADLPQEERSKIVIPQNTGQQRLLLRQLLTQREVPCVDDDFLTVQNNYLQELLKESGIIDAHSIEPVCEDFYLFIGEITNINTDAISCPVDKDLRGLPYPSHNKLDNVVHLFAGEQLKQNLKNILAQQESPVSIGQTYVTDGFNLPCKKIINMVAPKFQPNLTATIRNQLMVVTHAVLSCADKHGMKSVAFAKLSPNVSRAHSTEAARAVIDSALNYKKTTKSPIKIFFSFVNKQQTELFASLLLAEKATPSHARIFSNTKYENLFQ